MTGRMLEQLAGPRGLNAYLAGAAGSGMRGLATFLLADGWRVWGADRQGFAHDDPLLGAGLRPLSHDTVPPPVSLAIRSAAVPDDDPGFAAAVSNGAEPLRYAQMLGRISQVRTVVAVAGSHGKTTVTAWIAYGLQKAGIPTGYLFGARAPQLGDSASWGDPTFPLIVESCEYDRSFLQMTPQQIALLNVDAEHPDTYPGGLREVTGAFCEFVGNLRPNGLVLAGPEAPDLSASTRALWRTVSPLDAHAPVSLPGNHNRLNAAVVGAVLEEFGVGAAQVRDVLSSFQGVARRLEELGEWNGARVISDYAHHPAEVAATLQAVRERHPGRRVVCVFQPHQAVRFQAYQQGFAEALAPADAVLLLEVYRVRDPLEVRVSVRDLLPALTTAGSRPVAVSESNAASLDRLRAWVEPGDLLLFLGAGDVDALARSLPGGALSSATV